MKRLEERILQTLAKNRRKGCSAKELSKKINLSRADRADLRETLDSLTRQHKIAVRQDKYVLLGGKLTAGEVVGVNATYGFVRPISGEKDVFIPGRHLLGAMPGDQVLLRVEDTSSPMPRGRIEEITTPCDEPFSGVLLREDGQWFILPDQRAHFRLGVAAPPQGAAENDKVLARICYRGERHTEHLAEVETVFGSADSARNCCRAILLQNGVSERFADEVLLAAEQICAHGIHQGEIAARLDLRDEIIFTIDGADTKDIDDAVSLRRLPDGFELGVHIADVSYYVAHKSVLDTEAYRRGCSVYWADCVVPMLPPALSNGICSLNPQVDRLAFSALIRLRSDGEIINYQFVKTVIRSRVQGVYHEINSLLDGEGSAELREKYRDVLESVRQMSGLADILHRRRARQGRVELETVESKILLTPDGAVADVFPRTRGKSERIIEELMLTANQAAALFSQANGLPAVYRTHAAPDPEKMELLYQTLDRLGIAYPPAKIGPAAVLGAVLRHTQGHPAAPVVQGLVLRTMSKAVYCQTNTGHFGLAFTDYAHFTSPIRRYSDLAVHRILSAYVTGMRKDRIFGRFESFAQVASEQATRREMASIAAERGCEDCYKAEYMRRFIGDDFTGIISGVTAFGIYVRLPNTVEGLLSVRDFPEGRWAFDGSCAFQNERGEFLQLGDSLQVRVAAARVSMGQVDFLLPDDESR